MSSVTVTFEAVDVLALRIEMKRWLGQTEPAPQPCQCHVPLDADQRAMLSDIDGLFDELAAGHVTLSNGVEVINAEDEEARIGAMMMVHALPIWGDPREALADLDGGEEDDGDNEVTAEWPGMEVT